MPYLVKVIDKRELYGFSSFRIIEIMTFFFFFSFGKPPQTTKNPRTDSKELLLLPNKYIWL